MCFEKYFLQKSKIEIKTNNNTMFPRVLDNTRNIASLPPAVSDDYESHYEISDSGYGKDNVKILHIQRNGIKLAKLLNEIKYL